MKDPHITFSQQASLLTSAKLKQLPSSLTPALFAKGFYGMTFNPALVLRKFKGKDLNKQAPLFQRKVAPYFPLNPLVTFAGHGPTELWGQMELKVEASQISGGPSRMWGRERQRCEQHHTAWERAGNSPSSEGLAAASVPSHH